MSDLISREAAIEALHTHFKDGFEEDAWWNSTHVLVAIKEVPSAQPTIDPVKWIPVSERLPEEEKDVLVTVFFHGLTTKYKGGWNDHIKPKLYVEVANYFCGEWNSYSDEYKVARNRHEVMAWMPLPEPWKGEEGWKE